MFDDLVLEVFLRDQLKLFSEPVAETRDEAEGFLEEVFAEVVDSPEEVLEYLDEAGMDVTDMGKDDIAEIEEVFPIGDGRYLIVNA
ncbi:MAG: glyoxalase [Lachnospiraceae bacterium]|nr:glyoxalase [Lachnospiraceae bacterium]